MAKFIYNIRHYLIKTLQRLLGEHEVTFLSTPHFQNRKIKVAIRKVAVSIEGAAAMFHLATHDSLLVKDEEIYNGCIGVCEIGALTTDFPVIKRMAIDNHFSHGEQIGIATYLDAVIRDVEDAYGYASTLIFNASMSLGEAHLP
ncbi:hypothetical protein [Paenibacillus marchantiophytorum]|uniref:hypothetical protein n=1 Tax=Paenibacillus marchantiophytorum TaxID=1619310 RepID=UPI001662AFB9|nr:hypothetical protein [Paenibacillus marchantiophytorum]